VESGNHRFDTYAAVVTVTVVAASGIDDGNHVSNDIVGDRVGLVVAGIGNSSPGLALYRIN
jgi:hypothetical protein